jgi:hypothetical protein
VNSAAGTTIMTEPSFAWMISRISDASVPRTENSTIIPTAASAAAPANPIVFRLFIRSNSGS